MTVMGNIRYVLIFLSIVVSIGISGCIDRQIATRQTGIQNDQITTIVTNVQTNHSYDGKYVTSVTKNVCENCHMSGKSSVPQAMNVKPHVEGGSYCMICHNFSHEKHPINNNVTCNKCHEGENPTKPIFVNGNIVCNNCHDFPDPLKPSHGNIITIHENRNVTCITCHTEKCTKCHKEIGTGERWEKRLNHFKVILGASQYDGNI